MQHIKTFENFLSDSTLSENNEYELGNKANKFITQLDPDNEGLWMFYSDIMGDDEVEHIVSKNTKSLKAKDEDIIVVSSDLTEESFEWDEIVSLAKKSGLNFVSFSYEYDGTGIDAIAFSRKQ